MPLPERVVEDGFQLYQALFGPARQMQSYYGSSPAAKRFEVTLCERELQLPEGVVRAWNGEVLRWGHGSATGRVLSRGRPGRLARWYEDKKDQESPSTGSPSVDSSRSRIRRNTILGASPKLRKVATRYSLADAASQKRYAVPRSCSVPRSADVFRRRHIARFLLLAHEWRVQEIGARSRSAPIFARFLSCSPGCPDRGKDRARAANKPARSQSPI